ncbi:hypothetical protein L3Q82_012234, partial [Scortum barcoo]
RTPYAAILLVSSENLLEPFETPFPSFLKMNSLQKTQGVEWSWQPLQEWRHWLITRTAPRKLPQPSPACWALFLSTAPRHIGVVPARHEKDHPEYPSSLQTWDIVQEALVPKTDCLSSNLTLALLCSSGSTPLNSAVTLAFVGPSSSFSNASGGPGWL